MTANSHVLVVGSANMDLVVRGTRLPKPGETVLGGQFSEHLGGKGANQAVAAARCTLSPVTFIAALGDDTYGQAIRRAFAQENLVCDYVKTVPGAATGVALILVDAAGENLISVASGANVDLLPHDLDQIPDEVFRSAKVLLTNLESPLATVRRALERARAAGLRTILNPAPAISHLPAHVPLDLVDVLTPNAGEAALLSGVQVNDTISARRAAEALRDMGASEVIVTLGPAGAVLVGSSPLTVPAPKVQAIDTTGAGDAFNGALACALSEDHSLAAAVDWATRAAALSVTRAGAQASLAHRAEIEAFRGQ